MKQLLYHFSDKYACFIWNIAAKYVSNIWCFWNSSHIWKLKILWNGMIIFTYFILRNNFGSSWEGSWSCQHVPPWSIAMMVDSLLHSFLQLIGKNNTKKKQYFFATSLIYFRSTIQKMFLHQSGDPLAKDWCISVLDKFHSNDRDKLCPMLKCNSRPWWTILAPDVRLANLDP